MAPFLYASYMAASASVAATALDQVADGDHSKYQQVGGEDGHQPDDRGMEKQDRLGWLTPRIEKGANGSLFICVLYGTVSFSCSNDP
ncbi:hypothetical protein D3C80_1795310 [compost metagenome]